MSIYLLDTLTCDSHFFRSLIAMNDYIMCDITNPQKLQDHEGAEMGLRGNQTCVFDNGIGLRADQDSDNGSHTWELVDSVNVNCYYVGDHSNTFPSCRSCSIPTSLRQGYSRIHQTRSEGP